MTAQADVHSMSDHDLLIRVAVKVDAIEEHAETLNGEVAAIKKDQYFLKGAIGMLGFLMVLGVPLLIWGLNQV